MSVGCRSTIQTVIILSSDLIVWNKWFRISLRHTFSNANIFPLYLEHFSYFPVTLAWKVLTSAHLLTFSQPRALCYPCPPPYHRLWPPQPFQKLRHPESSLVGQKTQQENILNITKISFFSVQFFSDFIMFMITILLLLNSLIVKFNQVFQNVSIQVYLCQFRITWRKPSFSLSLGNSHFSL